MFGFIRCPFCHDLVWKPLFAAHKAEHTRLRPDGQMHEHITLPPESRLKGDLDGVPSVYRHPKCGGVTGMPEEIIRSYLQNPFLYNDRTFCTGCGDYVNQRELYWVETGENMFEYNERLRKEYRARNRS